ncbi:M14 family metallopeptidase [Andreprevotia chitinilytica]|uniref:M14 family metallopeptidase n=1 Tax=Andreprevotia chitinilytica TaxID=396808 RepID=UPI00054D9A65|nr:M14 family metallocarboxypeptidase [Andreprevotia chitinilytica]
MNEPTRDGKQTYRWQLPVEGCASNNWPRYQARLVELAERRQLQWTELGRVAGQPIVLLQPASAPDRPNLLIASGFHGEEPAGPWGVLRFLETATDALFARANISFLPLVNISGFAAGRRLNDAGQNPNRGFCPASGASEDHTGPSHEGLILQAHAELLTQLGRDGVLSCHEDVLVEHGYVYSFERSAVPGPFTRTLRDANARFFALLPDGEVDGCPIRDGIVFNHADSSFEAWMMQLGVRRAACTETPGKQDVDVRIAANAVMMSAFVEQSFVSP